MFTSKQYADAAEKYFAENPRLLVRFHGPKLFPAVIARMQKDGLPSVTSAQVAFETLRKEGALTRTDGKDSAYDLEQDNILLGQAVADATAINQKEPLAVWEIEWMASLSPAEKRLRFFENGGLNKFAARYALAIRDYGFQEILPVANER